MSQSKRGVFSVFKQEGNSRQAPFYCRWTEEEDKLLFEAVDMHGPHKWSLIARHIPGRTPVQCSTRWLGALNPHVHKGRWSKEEDEALTAAVKPHLNDVSITEDNLPWSRIAQYIPNRTGIQCQARWTEALDPSVRKGRWKKEEDDMLKVGVERFGCCWIRVAGSIPGRTQRQCRTRWNQIQSKRQKSQDDSAKPVTIKKQPQKKKKRADGDVVQWKPSCQQKTVNALSATPIQLAVPDQTPYILLSKQQQAIVIPSEILSPLQSPASFSSSSSSSLGEEEAGDYFCTSPTLTCSSSDTFVSSNKQNYTPSTLTAADAATLLDDFDSSFTSYATEKTDDSANHEALFNSLFSNDLLNQFDPDLPSLMLLDVPFNYNQAQPQQYQPQNASVSLENFLLDSELFLNYNPSTTETTILST
ncbi:hypothetical protein [Parasitella parasitica]|uniref:Homeodomain-like protein n=1 Tax=Parasitella parasitica TaxID=35722 RepID=A0A0B7NNY2_9FUNG|nr:hypothetical protein [Parasitella parasitica]